MKNFVFFPILILSLLITMEFIPDEKKESQASLKLYQPQSDISESLQGAWSSSEINGKGEKVEITTIVMDGYFAETIYHAESGAFIRTFGGSWTVDKNRFLLKLEFSSADSSAVGKTTEQIFDLEGDTIKFEGSEKVWTRIDNDQTGVLSGAWLISGRKRDGKMVLRSPGDRKTMKILSGTRFQWIAYNTATGKFSGTGGGTYTAENGTYTETIGFFSRDNSRVGAKLTFQYEVIENEWHHSGMSSKGRPIYEIWSPRIISQKNNN